MSAALPSWKTVRVFWPISKRLAKSVKTACRFS
jgi:hypothetical protein